MNAVAEAIRLLGGITATVAATRVSTATWHRYRKRGRIPDPVLLFAVADLTGLDPRALAGLPVGDHPEPPAGSPERTAAGARGTVRRLPRRREPEGPRVYGTIRGRERNNWPLFSEETHQREAA